jgi:hypothetical protein
VNLALHVACGLLVYDVAHRTLTLTGTEPGRERVVAFWAALLFLVHPLQTEAVTYVVSCSVPRSVPMIAACSGRRRC